MQEIMNCQNWRAQTDRITTLLSKLSKASRCTRWGRRICLGLSDFEKEDGKITPLLPSLKQTASALLGFQKYLQKWGGKNYGSHYPVASGNRLKEGSNLVSGAVLGSVIPFIVIIFIAIVFIFIYEYSRTGKYSRTGTQSWLAFQECQHNSCSAIYGCAYTDLSNAHFSCLDPHVFWSNTRATQPDLKLNFSQNGIGSSSKLCFVFIVPNNHKALNFWKL